MEKKTNNSLQNIFHQVAGVKLADLIKQRSATFNHFQPILDFVNSNSDNKSPHELLQILANCIESGPHFHETSPLIQELNVFLEYSMDNPTIHSALTQVWIQRVKEQIQYSANKAKYSELYGKLFQQWMELSQDDPTTDPHLPLEDEKRRTVEQLSQKIFTKPTNFDKTKLLKFLNTKLFNFERNRTQADKFQDLIRNTKEFSKMANFQVTNEITIATIRGLHSRNLFRNEKQAALLDLIRNQDAIVEITGILSDRLANYSHWNWPSPLGFEMIRGICGHYRAYMDEDTLTALFLQLVGVIWGVHFKSVLKKLYDSEFWNRRELDPRDYAQRNSIEAKRQNFHKGCFLTTLPENMTGHCQNEYDPAEDEDKYDENQQRNINPLQLRSKIVYVINTEVKLNQIVNPTGGLTVVQTDMEWFGPSLVHEAILTILEYFGVSEQWLQFFQRFLRAPIDFEGSVKIRERGVPICHSLSQLFGEINLFLLDVAVNKASGENLYRLYDDMWFWGRDELKMGAAWESIQELSDMVGLKVNLEKSGSVVTGSQAFLGGSEQIFGRGSLPQSPVRWGMLKLDSHQGFQIDPQAFEPFIEKFDQLLNKSSSVLGWITVYNKYMRFFIRDCGKHARCVGLDHLSRVIEVIKSIHHRLFLDVSPIKSLKSKFPGLLSDAIESWIYWPLAAGGLGLMNPFYELLPLLQSYKDENHNASFEDLPAQDVRNWERMKKSIEVNKKEEISTFEDYCKGREIRNDDWSCRYTQLMDSLYPKHPLSWKSTGISGHSQRSLTETEANTESWLNSTYGPEIQQHFGSTTIVDPKFIPVTLVAMLEKTKITT